MTNAATVAEPKMQIHHEAGVDFYLIPTPAGVEAVICDGVETRYSLLSLGDGRMRVRVAAPEFRSDAGYRHYDFCRWGLAASFIAEAIRKDGEQLPGAGSCEHADHWEEICDEDGLADPFLGGGRAAQ